MKIILTWPRASLPRFYKTALQDRIGQKASAILNFFPDISL